MIERRRSCRRSPTRSVWSPARWRTAVTTCPPPGPVSTARRCPSAASQERTTTHTPQALAAMKPHRGLAFGSPFLWQRGAGVWGFVDEGRESPASRVAAHTPRRREQPRENRHHPHKEKCAGVAPKRVARRPGRAKLPDPDEHPTPAPQETPRPQPTTHPTHSLPTPPRHHKKPHNPNPDEPPAVISAASSPCPTRDHRAPWAATDGASQVRSARTA